MPAATVENLGDMLNGLGDAIRRITSIYSKLAEEKPPTPIK